MTEIAKAGGSLAIRPDQLGWTDEQSAVLRQTGIDNDVTNAELASFLHLCQRTQLDPFSRQIYLIGRWDNRQKRKVFTPQTGIDGYRVIAHRVIAETRQTFGYEDTLWCDSNGQWRDVWLSAAAPAAAKVTVLRHGQRFSAVALYREYVQTDRHDNPTRMWANMGANQIAKCAEALALRKAFPHDLAGVYTAEEMAQADNPAGDGRHLRKVEPGQGDPWASAPNQMLNKVKGRSQHAEELAVSAADATDLASFREIYRQASAAGLLDETIKTSDRELMELGAFLIEHGQRLAAPPSEPGAADDGYRTGPTDDEVVDGEVVTTPEDDYADAVAELRAAADAAHLEDFDNGVAGALGMPLAEAPVEAIRALAAQIRPAA
ncbi:MULTISPECIES: phage recombination protein Bet [unclassified Streptomyces]|uniref:phage recombination protein Bet n=1 Tax=unclassified Streptomyces TaxID=2593676 RepID=UPI000804FB89|nr:phage recombination protein Bet [Streptomyces sp. OspMP-M45]MYR73030.1 phage recombination protein Bet [Streptomyces sp. SID4925]SBU95977.1 phage recombination protein Bet [Streptomyces sp. OspMP-M45]